MADDTAPAQNAPNAGSEENAAKIQTYEEAFRHIKEATGVSDTAEVCCFRSRAGGMVYGIVQ